MYFAQHGDTVRFPKALERIRRSNVSEMRTIMTQDEIESYRQNLIALAARLRSDDTTVGGEALRQGGGEASGNLSHVPLHLADMGTDAFERDMSASLLQNGRQIQAQVAAALDRIEQGLFGRCERCGGEIGKGRLQALPYTRYCVACAQGAEEEGEAGSQPTLL
jgi:DnaK suppressor protein